MAIISGNGLPIAIGDRVQIVALTDETAAASHLGQSGHVVYFDYFCGCGQSFPDDPMIGVMLGESVGEFWREELAHIELDGSLAQ